MRTDFLNVRDFGAVSDGVADDTAAFLKAIDSTRESRLPVYVPYGRYVLTETLALDGQTLVGYPFGTWGNDFDSLPVLLPRHKKGPVIDAVSSGVSGLEINYSLIEGSKTGDCGEMPPAIYLQGPGCHISNMKLWGAWEGIVCNDVNFDHGNPGRFCIENVHMHNVHKRGVYVGGGLDVSTMRDVEVWSPDSKIFPNEGVGYHFCKNDGVRLYGCFAFNVQIGFLFDEMHGREDFNGGTMGWMSNCDVDYSGFGIVVRGREKSEAGAIHYYPTILTVSGGSFWCHTAGFVLESGNATVEFNGVDFRSNGGECVRISSGDYVSINNCKIDRTFPYPPNEQAAVLVEGGKRVSVTNCMLVSRNTTVRLHEGFSSLVLTGNTITYGDEPIEDASGRTYAKIVANNACLPMAGVGI